MSVLYGIIGFIAAAAVFAGGYAFGARLVRYRSKRTQSAEEKQRIAEERERLRKEQEAFHTIQNYSVERAYGMLQDDLRGDST